MSIKKFLFTFQTIFILLASVLGQQTEIVYLSGKDAASPVDWDFMVNKGMKANIQSKVPVPSNWELHGFGAYNYGHDKNKSDETGFYKYHFKAQKTWEDKKVIIVFEGSMTDTEVKINGKLAGAVHQGGFYRFSYDITELITFDKDNLLEVKVNKVSADKSIEIAERKSDYWVFGGIYRPVYLKILPKEHIVRTAIDVKADGSFKVDVYYSGIKNAKSIEARIIDQSGKSISKLISEKIDPEKEFISLSTKVSGQKNWTAESPNLYYVDISIKQKDKTIHTVREHFGFRTIEVREGKGIFLNGKIITLKGADRHSFWPTSGRALSRNQCYNDVMLLKEMNMNAVRMSHYPPDTYFLDLCDEHGIYVLDELAGWQRPSYDTKPGKRLLKEMAIRDVNHPSILFWDNGNEGGWNKKLDKEFAKYDPQKRTVLHPWTLFGGIDTDHYEGYASVQNKMQGDNIFMPTEHLHGLYDGGLGAGLNDFWKLMWGNPLNGGMFLWVFADEGVVRTDKDWIIDTDGNHAPDGILGPFHEKEASFYTIKEIWSPVYIETNTEIESEFTGTIPVENRFDFTNLNQCSFKWQLIKYPELGNFNKKNRVVATGYFQGPNIPARKNGLLKLNLPDNWKESDAIVLTAYNHNNTKIQTWKWKIVANKEMVNNTLDKSKIVPEISRKGNFITLSANDFSFSFSKKTGLLKTVKNAENLIPFTEGPVFVSDKKELKTQTEKLKIDISKTVNSQTIDISNHPNFKKLKWTVFGSGWLKLDYTYTIKDSLDYMGVSFNFPESNMQGMKCLSKGPYRVWKNRLKGQSIDVWHKNYSNFQLNTKWDYPVFPGYYVDFSWTVFDTKTGYFTVMTENDDLFLRVFSQKDGEKPKHTSMIWPKGDISFLHAIPAIGTKFQKTKVLGPESQKFNANGNYSATLYFYFGLPK